MKLYITKAYPECDDRGIKELAPLPKGCHYDEEIEKWYTFRSLSSIIQEVGDVIISPPGGELEYALGVGKGKDKDYWLVVIYNTYVE